MHSGYIRTSHSKSYNLHRLNDTLCIILAVYLGYLSHNMNFSITASLLVILLISHTIASDLFKLYHKDILQGFKRSTVILFCIAAITLLAVLFILLSNEISLHIHLINYKYALNIFITTMMLMICWRLFCHILTSIINYFTQCTKNIAFIGVTQSGLALEKSFLSLKNRNINLLGFYEDRSAERIPYQTNIPVIGKVSQLIERAKQGNVDEVYIAMPISAKSRIKHYLSILADTTATTYILPDLSDFDLSTCILSHKGNTQVISTNQTPFTGYSSFIKRIQDLVLSSIILMIISPILAVISIVIKISSSGPILFKQCRYGLNGKKFSVWKFRTMSVSENGSNIKQAVRYDQRVTRFGQFLRQTSFDELPQFFNVLQGSMSIVGPRPHAVAHNEEYRHLVNKYMMRHIVKPGITGWAQINGLRGETDTLDKMQKRVEYDFQYIWKWSLYLDLKIILLTIIRGFNSKSAY